MPDDKVELIDLTPATSEIEVAGKTLTIYPLTLKQIIALIKRYRGINDIASKPMLEAITTVGAEGAGALIAAGLGRFGNKKQESLCAEWDFAVMVEIIDAIMKITTPKGDGPLAKGLSELIGMVLPIMMTKAAISAAASPSSSPSPSPASPENGADPKPSST